MNYGRHQITKELGKGAMGVVYQAHDPHIDRSIALKVLRHDRLASEAFLQRFLKEARAVGRLSHPGIVVVYDIGEDHGTVYIAMEFLEGRPLNEIIREKTFTAEEIVDLGIQVAEALDYAHRRGIVHRDIKPSNIIVEPSGRIKITDFGIAHIEDPDATQQTQAGEILGTPAYMSPEQVQSKPVDGRSDIFSLGVILYELATGKRPFRGEGLGAVFQSIISTEPPEPAGVSSTVSRKLSQVIMKCLAKDRRQRFTTGGELCDALKRSRAHGAPAASDSAPAHETSRKPLWMTAAALFAVLTVLAVLYGPFSRKPAVSPTPESTAAPEAAPDRSHAAQALSSSSSTAVAPPPESGIVAKPGFLEIETSPVGARVVVDGVFKGTTPTRVEVAPGTHEVRLTLADYADWEAQVRVEENEVTRIPSIELYPLEEGKP